MFRVRDSPPLARDPVVCMLCARDSRPVRAALPFVCSARATLRLVRGPASCMLRARDFPPRARPCHLLAPRATPRPARGPVIRLLRARCHSPAPRATLDVSSLPFFEKISEIFIQLISEKLYEELIGKSPPLCEFSGNNHIIPRVGASVLFSANAKTTFQVRCPLLPPGPSSSPILD